MYQHSNQGDEAKLRPARSDFPQSRKTILSYKFEVERLGADYSRLRYNYYQVLGEYARLVRGTNRDIEQLNRSTIWRVVCLVIGALHRLKGKGAYRRLFARPIRERVFPDLAPFNGVPELSSIPELHYEALPAKTSKNWESARFLSAYSHNEIDEILGRYPEGERKIFIQSPIIDWFVPLYQRPQHMALAMARRGYVVFYMTSNSLGDKATGFHEVAPNVFITSQPVHLMVERALISFYSTAATLLSWQGHIVDRIRELGSTILYEYIDHIDPDISFDTTDRLAAQFALVDDDHVDLALASAGLLVDELRQKLSRVPIAYVANGVDTEHYHETIDHDAGCTLPRSIRPVVEAGRPVVGYFGAMAPWLWYSVMNELAALRPDLSFVYIGPDYLGGSELLEPRENVYAIGPVDYPLLPFHAQHFDVGIIPFKPGDIARSTSPLKLFEYFALGKPVVVTKGMLECEQFEEVFVADSAESFSKAIDEALARTADPVVVQHYRARANENTWDVRAATLDRAYEQLPREMKV